MTVVDGIPSSYLYFCFRLFLPSSSTFLCLFFLRISPELYSYLDMWDLVADSYHADTHVSIL